MTPLPFVPRLIGAFDDGTPGLLRLFGWRSRWVETSRGRLHYFDVAGHGDGPPIVLVHGLGSRAADYALLVRRLRRTTRRLILPDLPGHGWSQGDDPDAEQLETVLNEAVEALLPEPSWVLGNSMGGLIAVRMALHAPDRVRGLVLASPAGAPLAAAALHELRELFLVDNHASAVHFVQRLLAGPARLRHVLAAGLRARLARGSIRSILGRIRNEDLLHPEQVRSLRMPIYFFWGAADRILDGDQLAWYRRSLPDHARIETPEGYGHSPFLDHPGRFARLVRGFVDEMEDARRGGA